MHKVSAPQCIQWLSDFFRPYKARRDACRRLGVCIGVLFFAGMALISQVSQAAMQVEVHGASDQLANNLQVFTSADLESVCQSTRWQRNQLLEKLADKIRQAGQALGYYQMTWQSQWQEGDCWTLVITVSPGERMRIDAVELTFAPHRPENQLLSDDLLTRLPIQIGQWLNHRDYDAAKTRLLRLLQNYGYWQSSWLQQELRVNPQTNRAQVLWSIDLGPQYYFGELVIDEQTHLNHDVIRRLADLPYGELYDRRAVDRAYRRLQNSGYFSTLLLEPQFPDSDTQRTSIETQMSSGMASRYRLSGGVGYSTDHGMRLNGSFTDAYVNRAGHSWGLSALWSNIKNEAVISYKIPLKDPAREWLNNELNYLYEDTDSYISDTYSGGVNYIQRLAERWGWYTGLRYQKDFYQLTGRTSKENSGLLIPSVGANYIVLDNAARPTLGMRIEGWLQGAQSELGSDTSFLQAQVSGKGIVPIWSKLRLIGRGQLGYTLKEDFDELPPSIRFYTGGDSSVRGYEYKSIGELDSFGNVQGGSQLVVGSVELDQSVGRDYSMALFFDVGSAFDDGPNYQRGVGIGGRWYSPVGPFRVDIAYPIDSDDNYVFHISLGADL